MSLEVKNLTRRFGDRLALDDVSFTVKPGRLTGFVGGNGAGKTTAMRIIMAVLAPHGGTVLFRGEPLGDEQRRQFGYMPEERGLYPKMRLREQLVYFARLHGFSISNAEQKADELLAVFGLTERAGDPVEQLSLGNQQRAQVAVALVHDPVALILDEPFSSLDPMAVDTILAVLRERAQQGLPVLISSHQLDLLERLCDDLVIISAGKIRAEGSIADLRRQYGTQQYNIEAASDLGWLREKPGVRVVAEGDACNRKNCLIEVEDSAYAYKLLSEAVGRGPVFDFSYQVPRLSEIFREVVYDAEVNQQ